jgi:hypothetical protein
MPNGRTADSLLAVVCVRFQAKPLTIKVFNQVCPHEKVCHMLHISLQFGGCASHLRHTWWASDAQHFSAVREWTMRPRMTTRYALHLPWALPAATITSYI